MSTMRTMILTIGLPASGKSTWAKEQLKKEPKRWKRINKDDLRAMLDNSVWTPENEKIVTYTQEYCVKTAFNYGFDVIVDNTHLNRRAVKQMHALAEQHGNVNVIEKVFMTDLETCIARDKLRTGNACVGEDVIRGMYNKAQLKKGWPSDRETYYQPKGNFKAREQDPSLPHAFICDLDGTVTDGNGRDFFDASTCDNDLVIQPVLDIMKDAAARGLQPLFVTGREQKYEEPTRRWLDHHFTTASGSSIPYILHMRATADMRPDNVVKAEIFHEKIEPFYQIDFVADDRPKVVRMWRWELGLLTLQLTDREF